MAANHTPQAISQNSDDFSLRLAVLLMPQYMTNTNLQLMSQVGVTDIVACVPDNPSNLDDLLKLRNMIANHGLRLSVLERYWPHDKIVQNLPGKREQIELTKTLIKNMSICGVECLCYNWMQSSDWSRTCIDATTRGGALVSAFRENDPHQEIGEIGGQAPVQKPATTDELWQSLQDFLEEVIPVCEKYGVKLSLHPDDPPLRKLRGMDQIFFSAENMERAAKLFPSPANGICFGQGTLASAGENIPAAVERLAPYINFIHFRDVVGIASDFKEVWQDEGKTDMVAVMDAFRANNVTNVIIRPDHVRSGCNTIFFFL